MQPEIRPATEADIAAVATIYAHHVRSGLASFEVDPPSVEEMQQRFDKLVPAGFPYLVAVERGEVLGYAYAGPYRPRPAYRFSVEDSIYLAPEAAGRGIGKAMLTRLVEECEARGFRQMLAIIGDSANYASIGVHRACGFTQKAVLDAIGYKFGRWVDSVIMQRALGAGRSRAPD